MSVTKHRGGHTGENNPRNHGTVPGMEVIEEVEEKPTRNREEETKKKKGLWSCGDHMKKIIMK